LLTDRQATLLRTAVERGYDDTPRDRTLTGLTDHVGVAKSTRGGTLHPVESRVVRRFVGDDPALDAHLSDRPRVAPHRRTRTHASSGRRRRSEGPSRATTGPTSRSDAGSGPDLAGTGGS
jgi:hypothetical protein